MEKRYWKFEFDTYYPSGPAGDFVGAYATLDEAVAATRGPSDHAQIIDVVEVAISHDLGKTWDPLTP